MRQNIGESNFILDLCDKSSEQKLKIYLRNVTNPNTYKIAINNGTTLSESIMNEFPIELQNGIHLDKLKENPISLIIPQLPQVNSQIHKLYLSNLSDTTGIFMKVKQHPLCDGIHRIGLPAGENIQIVIVVGSKVTINDIEFDIVNKPIVMVKKLTQSMETEPNTCVKIKDPTDSTSSRHCTFEWINNSVVLHDGANQGVSKNGVWLLLPHNNKSEYLVDQVYCFTEFRLLLKIK